MAPVTDNVCHDCEGALALVTPDVGLLDATRPGSDLDLMCVLCGAALSRGGLLLGEVDAWEDARGVA